MTTVAKRVTSVKALINQLVKELPLSTDGKADERRNLLVNFQSDDAAAAFELAVAILDGRVRLRIVVLAHETECVGRISFFRLRMSNTVEDQRDAIALILHCYKMAVNADRKDPIEGWREEMYSWLARCLRTGLVPLDAAEYLEFGVDPDIYDRLARGGKISITDADSPASAESESIRSDSPAAGFACQS